MREPTVVDEPTTVPFEGVAAAWVELARWPGPTDRPAAPSLSVRLAGIYVGVVEGDSMGYGDAFGQDGLVTAWGLLAATSLTMVLLWTAGESTDGPGRALGDPAVGAFVGGVGAVLLPTVALVLLLVVALVSVHRAAP